MEQHVGKAKINISGEIVEVTITVNNEGNLELSGIPIVMCEMWGDELVLMKYDLPPQEY